MNAATNTIAMTNTASAVLIRRYLATEKSGSGVPPRRAAACDDASEYERQRQHVNRREKRGSDHGRSVRRNPFCY